MCSGCPRADSGGIAISCCCGARRASPPSARASRAPRCRWRRSSSSTRPPTTSACSPSRCRCPACWSRGSAGGWVDRHRRRPLLIATDVIRAVALLAIPLAALAPRAVAARPVRGRRDHRHLHGALQPRRPRVHHRSRVAQAPARRQRQARGGRRRRRDLRTRARRRAGRAVDGAASPSPPTPRPSSRRRC